MRAIAPLAISLLLAGCADNAFMARHGGAISPQVQTAPLVALDAREQVEPLIYVPSEAGGVLRIRERHFPNGTRQEIVLAGGTMGENVVEISVRTSGGGDAPRGWLQIGKPSERGIITEAANRLPGMKMHVVTRPLNNAFGPIGLAVGRRADGQRCLFAWQWIEDMGLGAAGRGLAMLAPATPGSLRVRLCRNNMTLDEMAGLMEALRPGEPSARARIARLDRRTISAGPITAAGAPEPLVAAPRSLEAAIPAAPAPGVARPQPAAAGAAPAPRVRVARAAPPRPARRAAPPGSPESHGWPPPGQMETLPHTQGPRFLAPVGDVATMSTPTGAAAPPRLNPALPSRAYLGPGAAGADVHRPRGQ